jgi:hypothetical protein
LPPLAEAPMQSDRVTLAKQISASHEANKPTLNGEIMVVCQRSA